MKLIVSLALVLLSSSCASIVTGKEDSVQILTTPPGASFSTNTGHRGVTPSTISIPDSVNLEVDFTLDGFHPQHATLARKGSGWLMGNILLGGIIGLAIDLGTGNWYTHPKTLEVVLTPSDQPLPVAVEPEKPKTGKFAGIDRSPSSPAQP